MPSDEEERLVRRFTDMQVPRCVRCGSEDTASVQVGVIGLTLRLAATCRKFKLIPDGPQPGEWFCHGCGRFFDTPADGSVKSDGGAPPRPRFVRFDFPPGAGPAEIAAAIEAMRAKYRAERKARDEARKAQDTKSQEPPDAADTEA